MYDSDWRPAPRRRRSQYEWYSPLLYAEDCVCNEDCRSVTRWRRSQCKCYSRLLYTEGAACKKHCRSTPRWTRSQYYWYSRLLYTGDATCIKATAGPLCAGDVPSATGLVASSILEMLYNKQCRPDPRWTRSQYYWNSRLPKTGDVVGITCCTLDAFLLLLGKS